MCPSCISGGIGPGYIMAFLICLLFFMIAGGALFWASRNGKLDDLEGTKHAMLKDEDE